MRRREFIALLSSGLVGLALPRICLAQYRYYEGSVPDEAYQDESVKWGKHIWIWQYDQRGEAIQDGKIIFTFRIITGLEESRLATREGNFRIYKKKGWGYNNCDGVEMPLAMFFDGTRALHGWSRTWPFPTDDDRPWLASHGCISVDQIERLYNWADIGTEVHVRGERTGHY